jgi:hypothetical protein
MKSTHYLDSEVIKEHFPAVEEMRSTHYLDSEVIKEHFPAVEEMIPIPHPRIIA